MPEPDPSLSAGLLWAVRAADRYPGEYLGRQRQLTERRGAWADATPRENAVRVVRTRQGRLLITQDVHHPRPPRDRRTGSHRATVDHELNPQRAWRRLNSP